MVGGISAWWFAAVVASAGCDRVLGLESIHVSFTSPRAVVFDNSSSASDLVDVPVLVALDSSKIPYEAVTDPATDLRFTDDSGDLAFEVEQWDPAGESVVWVRVPRIPARSTTTSILMYFGPDAGGHAASAAVWRDFALVYHGDGGTSAVDSTVAAMPTADLDTGVLPELAAPGVIGSATKFAGLSGQNVTFSSTDGLLSGWDQFTIELWMAPNYPEPILLGGDEPMVFGKTGGPISLGRMWNTDKVDGAPLTMQVDCNFDSNVLYPQLYIPNREWSYVTYTYDGQFLWTYRNGVAIGVDANPMTLALATGSQSFLIGGEQSRTPILGAIDEVRLSKVYRETDWILAQYLAMTGHFVTIRDP